MGNDFFWDGVNLSTEEFYSRLKDSSQFPKTSLPSLEETQKLVDFYTGQGDEVLIITISSGISGTYQTMKMLFNEYENVEVFDSKLAVGGIRFLVEEARRYDNATMEVLTKKRGIKQGKRALVEMLEEDRADKEYGIIASYTYNRGNIDEVIQMLPQEYKKAISVYDDLCSSIACHWGPNAFGFIYVKEIL